MSLGGTSRGNISIVANIVSYYDFSRELIGSMLSRRKVFNFLARVFRFLATRPLCKIRVLFLISSLLEESAAYLAKRASYTAPLIITSRNYLATSTTLRRTRYLAST